MLAAVPLLLLPVLAYNVVAVLMSDAGFRTLDAGAKLSAPLFTVTMPSGAPWSVGTGDLLLLVSLVVLFVELLRSTGTGRAAIVNHSLSMLLFGGCLVEFLLFEAFATSTFVLIGAIVLVDVLAGFTVSLVGARRDVEYSG